MRRRRTLRHSRPPLTQEQKLEKIKLDRSVMGEWRDEIRRKISVETEKVKANQRELLDIEHQVRELTQSTAPMEPAVVNQLKALMGRFGELDAKRKQAAENQKIWEEELEKAETQYKALKENENTIEKQLRTPYETWKAERTKQWQDEKKSKKENQELRELEISYRYDLAQYGFREIEVRGEKQGSVALLQDYIDNVTRLESLKRERDLHEKQHKRSAELVGQIDTYREDTKRERTEQFGFQKLLDRYLRIPFAEQNQNPKEILQNLPHHLEQVAVCRRMELFRGSVPVASLSPEQQVQFRVAERWVDYYVTHVQNVLLDYGIQLDEKGHATVRDIDVEEQTRRWAADTERLKVLSGERLTKGDGKLNGNLQHLEQMAGIVNAEVLDPFIRKNAFPTEENEVAIEKVNAKTGAKVIRYKEDFYGRTKAGMYARNIYNRLLAVCTAYEEQLKEEQQAQQIKGIRECLEKIVGEQLGATHKSSDLVDDASMQAMTKAKSLLAQMLVQSESLAQKQFASQLLQYFNREKDGYLDVTKLDGPHFEMAEKDYEESIKRKGKEFSKHQKKEIKVQMQDRRNRPLFSREPSVNDVKQGHLGDCFFVSTLADLVEAKPQAIKDMMRDNGNGTVTVRFYRQKKGIFTPFYVTVEKTIPAVMGDKALYNDAFGTGSFWVKIMEKAYSIAMRVIKRDNDKAVNKEKEHIGYTYLDQGGRMSDAMEALLGKTAEYQDFIVQKQYSNDFGSQYNDPFEPELHFGDFCPPSMLGTKSEDAKYKEAYQLIYYCFERLMVTNHEIMDDLFSKKMEANLRTVQVELESQIGKLASSVPKGKKTLPSDYPLKGKPSLLHYDALRSYWKACNSNTEELYGVLREVCADMAKEFQKIRGGENPPDGFNEYRDDEKELFDRIERALSENRLVGFGTPREMRKKYTNGKDGSSGEHNADGIYGGHAYSILGTVKKNVHGQEFYFFKVRNPHGHAIPKTTITPNAEVRRELMDKEDEKAGYGYDARGVFLLELRDFFTHTRARHIDFSSPMA